MIYLNQRDTIVAMKERERKKKKDRPSENKNVLWRGTHEITDLIRRMRFRVCGFIELTQCVCVLSLVWAYVLKYSYFQRNMSTLKRTHAKQCWKSTRMNLPFDVLIYFFIFYAACIYNGDNKCQSIIKIACVFSLCN